MNNHHIEKHHHADCESCYSEPPVPSTCAPNCRYESLFFADGERSIDFVLVWQPVEDRVQEDLNCRKRAIFEDNLINEGLELERETVEDHLNCTKIHTPIEVLRRYAEILKLRMPMAEVSCSYNCFRRFFFHRVYYNTPGQTLFSVIVFCTRTKSIFSPIECGTLYLE